HVPRVHLAQLVGHVVPGRGAGGWRIRRATDVQRQRRTSLTARDALVQHRTLRHPAVALDPGRDGIVDPLSWPRGSGDWLHPAHDRPPARGAAWTHGRGFRGGIHVYD